MKIYDARRILVDMQFELPNTEMEKRRAIGVALSLIDDKRMKTEQRKKGKWRVYEGVMKCCVCGDEYDDDIMQYFGDSVPAFCPSCGADMRKDGDTK